MAQKHFGKSRTSRPELKQHVVVPFPVKTGVDQKRHAQTVVDPYRWFRFRLRNGFTGAVPILERDVARLWRSVREPETFHSFAVFDSPTRRIGLNLRHMTCSQFDGHRGAGLLADAVPDTGTVDIVFSDSKEPLHIEIEPDEFALLDGHYKKRSKIMEDEAAATLVQIAMLFSYCESTHTGSDYVECLQDASCSSIWIRLNDVALVSAPIGHLKAEWRKTKTCRDAPEERV
ncbi:MAG: hypothetical protein J0J01_26605 [Reyranella sp.]|uniref:hypothetical protein n=1 Tax=Reyranella sp. TaxID=1929291 RepID=UPI001AD138D0|nr:hypothetical protein [Reyranella sp.]MBN9090498.1 hypothetical protein [Reyranella sp.]